VETSSTKVICQQAIQNMEGQEANFLIMRGEVKSEESLDIIPKVAEIKDLRIKQEELMQDSNSEYPCLQHMNSKFNIGMHIEEPTSDTDLDEHEINRQHQLSVSHRVSIMSLTSDDENSLKASISKTCSAEDASHDYGYSSHVPHMDDLVDMEYQKGKLFHIAPCDVHNKGLREIRLTLEETKSEKGKVAEEASYSGKKYDFKVAHITSSAPEAKKGMNLELCAGEEVESVVQRQVIQLGEQVPECEPLKGQRKGDEDGDDPAFEALLQRIRKQRSVLEEILDKEEERKHEGKG